MMYIHISALDMQKKSIEHNNASQSLKLLDNFLSSNIFFKEWNYKQNNIE